MFTKEKIIFLKKEIKSKNELFSIIANKAVELKISDDYDSVYEGLQKRENEGSTGFQDGFGIPHCKSKTIKEPTILFIRSEKPIEWDSIDGKPLENLFSLLIPEENASEHLQLLVKISRKLMNKEFRQNIKDSKNENDILKVLKEI